MVADAGVVEDSAERPQGDANAVGAAEAAELAAAFNVRLQVEKHAGDPAAFELLLQLGDEFAEVDEDPFVAAVALVGRDEVLERFFVDVGRATDRLGVAVILDVHPAQARSHGEILLVNFGGRETLTGDVRAVEDRDHGRVIDLPVQFSQKLSRLSDEVGFHFQSKSQITAVADFGNLAELVHCLRDVFPRVATLGWIERKAADQFRLKRMGQVASLLDVLVEVLLERDELVLGAVVDVFQLYLANRATDRGDVHAIFVFQVAKLGDFTFGQLHHILDAATHIDESQAVVLQTDGREGGKLLDGRLVVGAFVGKAGEDDLWFGGVAHKISV